jgi:hypothetical protein
LYKLCRYAFRFENLELLLRLAEARGLRVVVQLYLDSAPDWVGERYPEAQFVDRSGAVIKSQASPGFCIDHSGVRAEVVKFYTEQLSAAGFGWMSWVIREGRAISTRRDRYDGNGIGGQGFHPFFTKEGKLRGGLEFLTEKPKLRAPWEKA